MGGTPRLVSLDVVCRKKRSFKVSRHGNDFDQCKSQALPALKNRPQAKQHRSVGSPRLLLDGFIVKSARVI